MASGLHDTRPRRLRRPSVLRLIWIVGGAAQAGAAAAQHTSCGVGRVRSDRQRPPYLLTVYFTTYSNTVPVLCVCGYCTVVGLVTLSRPHASSSSGVLHAVGVAIGRPRADWRHQGRRARHTARLRGPFHAASWLRPLPATDVWREHKRKGSRRIHQRARAYAKRHESDAGEWLVGGGWVVGRRWVVGGGWFTTHANPTPLHQEIMHHSHHSHHHTRNPGTPHPAPGNHAQLQALTRLRLRLFPPGR